MKVLVTGFDPFGGEAVNPAFEAVKLLPDQIAGAQIIKLEIPTVFTRSARVVEQAMEEHKPDIVIDVGQAGGRSCMTVEKVAINLAEARIPDNDGELPYENGQVVNKPNGTPFMPLDLIAKGLEYAIEAAVQTTEDAEVTMVETP